MTFKMFTNTTSFLLDIANGHQQINNGQASNETSTRALARTRENQTKPNELRDKLASSILSYHAQTFI